MPWKWILLSCKCLQKAVIWSKQVSLPSLLKIWCSEDQFCLLSSSKMIFVPSFAHYIQVRSVCPSHSAQLGRKKKVFLSVLSSFIHKAPILSSRAVREIRPDMKAALVSLLVMWHGFMMGLWKVIHDQNGSCWLSF